MTVHGVGIDVVDTVRVERLLARSMRFASRWFTPDEIDQCQSLARPARAYAQRLAAKEAVWKALALDDWSGGVPWRDIGISRGIGGVTVELTGSVAQACIGIDGIHVAFTHRSGRALAVAVTERRSLGPSPPSIEDRCRPRPVRRRQDQTPE